MIVKELFATLGLEVAEGGFEKAEALIGGLKKGLLGAGLALAGAGLGLLELGRETANAGFEADKAARRLGVTTDAIQELNYAARASQVEVDTLQTAMFRMERAGYAARKGTAGAAEAFLGLLSAHDLKTLSPDQALEKMAEGFSKIKDPGERADKITRIFGRGAADLGLLLGKGAEGIADLRREAHAMGLVLSQETIQDAKEFKKYLREASEQAEAFKFAIGAPVLRGLVQFTHWLGRAKKATADFVKLHKDGLLQSMKAALLVLTAALLTFAVANAGAAGGVIASWAAMAASAVASAATMVASWVAAAAPFIPLAAAIFGVLLVLEDLYQFLTGGESVIGDAVRDIKSLISEYDNFWGLLKDLAKWVAEGIFGPEASATLEKFFSSLEGKLKRSSDYILNILGANKELVHEGQPATGFSGGAVSPAASAISSAVTNTSRMVAPSFAATINISAPDGDPNAIASKVKSFVEDFYDSRMRESAAGVP